MIELLAPAGDEAALRAAVCAGANAVYLGYSAFGARVSAVNFDAEALEKAVAYAHLYGVRVHVTVNTLVKPGELERVDEALTTIAACKADAVIVQDLGVARLVRERHPSLRLHASTQMALHTASGARWAREQGFERVVLARECPLSVAAEVARTGVETEVFCHGALCAGVSGQCLMSSMAGGRSGNRGRCAQPCRQQVTLNGETAAFLSMKDLCVRDHLDELAAAGVCSLKIEGRLKRAEYVAVVTESYRKALDALEEGRFAPASDEEKRGLLQIFQRGGFTAGHLFGAQDAALCAPARVTHGGAVIGRVESVRGTLADVRLTRPLHDGDGLRLQGARETELRYSGPERTDAATLRLRPGEQTRAGDEVIRLTDAAQLARANALREPGIPVTLRAEVLAGEPMRLTASDGTSEATAVGDAAQTPLKRALTEDEIRKQLCKLGDTPFALDRLDIRMNEVFAPVSALNALRREALEQLAQTRREAFFGRAVNAPESLALPGMGRDDSLVNELAVRFADAEMGAALREAGATLLLYAPWDLTALESELPKLPPNTWLELPSQLSDAAYAAVRPLLKAPLAGVAVGSVGQLGFDLPLPVALGDGVPVTNALAAETLTRGAAFAVLWP